MTDALIGKGFKEPTERVKRLKNAVLDAMPMIEVERALLVTDIYEQTEGEPTILRRAKVNEHLFNHMHITIRDDELIVGAPCKSIRSSELFPEYSLEWLEPELDTVETRLCDRFAIREEDKDVVRELVKKWKGKTMSDYATSLMSQEALDCQDYAMFNVGNYQFAGVGHVCCNYEKVLKEGFKGILKDAVEALDNLDVDDPDAIKKRQFYKSIIITYTAAINFAHRYGAKAKEMADQERDPKRREELLQISKNCYKVPENPATTFWEALQSFWFVHLLINIETNAHSYSPGPFDRYIYPFYEKDASIDKEFAQELLDCLFVKFNDKNKVRDDVSAQAFAGYQMFELLALGGTDEDGRDLTNDISYMCLDALAHVGLPMPSVGCRIGNQTPDEFLYRSCEVIRLGYGMPNLFNDEVIIPAMVNRGIPLKLARTYTPSGCVEPDIAHQYDGWHDAAAFNVAHVLDVTLNNGRSYNGKQLGPKTGEIDTFTSIDDFIKAFDKQMEYFVGKMVESDNCIDTAHGDLVPLPFESALIEGCMEKGKSVQQGGAKFNFSGPQGVGVVDAGDSLYCIYKNVFKDKKMTVKELKDALENNFGYPVPNIGSTELSIASGNANGATVDVSGVDLSSNNAEDLIYQRVKEILGGSSSNLSNLRNSINSNGTTAKSNNPRYEEILRILRKTEAFGNDNDEVDQFSHIAGRIYCEQVEKHRNARGGRFQAGMYPVSANVLYGKDCGPLPTGRLAKEPLADGVSPRAGFDRLGPTAAANSVSKLDHALASNGTLYNMKFSPGALAGDKGLMNLASLVRGYFARKGMHIQFNCIDRDTLIDAQKHPEKHKDLVIRVAGYSAQFIGLAKEVQDNIIARTEMEF